jgi:hypothetical protein
VPNVINLVISSEATVSCIYLSQFYDQGPLELERCPGGLAVTVLGTARSSRGRVLGHLASDLGYQDTDSVCLESQAILLCEFGVTFSVRPFFRPAGARSSLTFYPRLAAWAEFLRRFAARACVAASGPVAISPG